MWVFGQIVTLLTEILAATRANGAKLDTVNANLEKLIAAQAGKDAARSLALLRAK